MAIPILLGGCYVYAFGPFVLISSAFANTVMQLANLPKAYDSRPIKLNALSYLIIRNSLFYFVYIVKPPCVAIVHFNCVQVFIGSNLNETVGVLLYDVNIILTGLEERDFS